MIFKVRLQSDISDENNYGAVVSFNKMLGLGELVRILIIQEFASNLATYLF